MRTDSNIFSRDGEAGLSDFRRRGNPARVWSCPIPHPSTPSEFCPCSRSFSHSLPFYLKAAFLDVVLKLPINALAIWTLRKMGAEIADRVFISAGVWIDPLFPDLLKIEEDVLIGSGAKIGFHEFRQDTFLAGRVTLRKKAIIGAFALIGPGVEIGEGATVAGGAVVGRDVPPGTIAGGNPMRVIAGAR